MKEEAKPVDIAREIMKNTSVYYTFSKVVVAAVKPVKLHHITKKTDDGFERILLHNTAGMAVEFSDGTGVFAIEGYTGKSLLECAMEMRIDKAGKEQ